MNHRSLNAGLVVMALSVAATAGTIEGKVSPGNSVVYVEAAPGKTFPTPTQTPVINQTGLTFNPHLLVVQERTTVEFENDDNVQHNVLWPSVGSNKKFAHNMGT